MLRTVANCPGRRMMMLRRHRIRSQNLIHKNRRDRRTQKDGCMGETKATIVELGGWRIGTIARLAVCTGLADRGPKASARLWSADTQRHRVHQRLHDCQCDSKQRRYQRERAQLRRRLPSGH